MVLTYAIILLYLIIYFIISYYIKLYCDETSNIVLDHVTVTHLCDGFIS